MDPVLVEVTRGGLVESAHRGAVAVVDTTGAVAFSVGDIDQAVFPRSAVKGILALPLVETGAADRFDLSDPELALACASHSGEEIHAEAAASILAKAGRSVGDLECGAHWPRQRAAWAMTAAGRTPTAAHNNCSGKHSGLICLACARGEPVAGYSHADHPTMRVATRALSDLTGTTLDRRNMGIDGCSIPTFAIPLRALALAFARFGTGHGLPADRAAAAARLRAAVAKHPRMIGGVDSFDTDLTTLVGERIYIKTGAEGVYAAAIPALGLGVALKCNDGAGRASEMAVAGVLRKLLPDEPALPAFTHKTLRNWNRIEVGAIRPTAALA